MKEKGKSIKRRCLVCGRGMVIKLDKNGKYSKGHYFGKIEVPVGKGKYKKVDTYKIHGNEIDVVKWTGKKKGIEYWECDNCFKEADFECRLKDKIESLFGKRCKDYESGCPVCEAWKVYDVIKEDFRENL